MVIRIRTLDVYAVALGVLMLGGCTKKLDAPPPTSGQVVAHIGSQVITTLELDNEMRVANVPAENRTDPKFLKQVLDEMVLRKYLVTQATGSKLDQEPSVLMDVMRSREQVLASAYMVRQGADISVTDSDIDQYIEQNPAKFAQRTMLSVDQIRFAIPANSRLLMEANRSANSLDEIDHALSLRDIVHVRSLGQLNQADLSESVANSLQAKPNGIFFGQAGGTATYFVVKGKDTKPLMGSAAKSAARPLVFAQKMRDALDTAKKAAQSTAIYSPQYVSVMAPPSTPEAAKEPGASAEPIEPAASEPKIP